MDCRPEYIKMCDCEEIQRLSPKPSDERETDLGSIFWSKTDELLAYLVEDNDTAWWMIGDYGDVESKFIWLPRQDQLQEMVGVKEVFDGMWVQWLRFCVDENWIIQEYPLRFRASMEQLWLAFYMAEKHKKIWSGDKWEIE